MADVFWPYRPRPGYPSAPAGLTLLALSGAVVFAVAVLIFIYRAIP
jgi:hypothetical protein